MLARREARQCRQVALWEAHGSPVVSLTVVSPGPVKSSLRITRIFEQGLGAVRCLVSERGWVVREADEVRAETGPEWLASVEAPAELLKRALCALEDGEPWGRLWDCDVVVDGRPMSREDVGLRPRQCLVCDRDARECARSRRHPVEELEAAIAKLVGDA